ncbi:MAG: MMPL family transporter [Thermomicrobiales bacterium]
MDLSIFLVNMTTMMGLALGIDYALFIVRRYREERVRSDSRIEAIARTGDSASRAVLFSGGIVIVALFGLFLIPTTIFRSLALGAILAVVAAVLAMLTLVPALLSLIGDRLDWPRRQPGWVPPPRRSRSGARSRGG